MELTVYRQAVKQRPDGQKIYKGEDALPYAGENVLLVADGLGGASSIRHRQFCKDMFDSAKLFDVLFDGVFAPRGGADKAKDVAAGADGGADKAVCDEKAETADTEKNDVYGLREYTEKSFSEFLSVKDCYLDNVNNIKKSGYFASRIVTALFLHLCGQFAPRVTPSDLDGCAADGGRNEWTKKVGAYFTDNIKEMLQKVSKNSNLIYESSFNGLSLLATTLCAAVTFESQSYVDALYFVAGDSRPYMLCADGMFQVAADQERADGGMTNYIKANGDFYISCEHRRFAKPCVLLNATDGIFDSKQFKLSPLALEKLLCEVLADAESLDGAGARLEELFADYGTHDDSSTAAVKTFGYARFEDLQRAARERLRRISDKYLRGFEDLLERDYAAELDGIDGKKAKLDAAIRDGLWLEKSVKDYCVRRAGRSGGGEFAAKSHEVRTRLASGYEKLVAQKNALLSFLASVIGTDGRGYCARAAGAGLDTVQCKVLAKKLIADEADIGAVGIGGNEREALSRLLGVCRESWAAIDEDERELTRLTEIEAKRLWDEFCRSESNILKYVTMRGLISGEQYEKYRAEFGGLPGPEERALRLKAAEQERRLKEYDKVYCSLLRED